MSERVLVMARPPVLGQVKTRIAAELGDKVALAVYEKLLQHTLEVVRTSGFEHTLFATSAPEFFSGLGFQSELQIGHDLGERMEQAFELAFSRQASPVVMIGTDCPYMEHDVLHRAFDSLSRVDLVLGPAADGGYYLIGMNRHLPELMRGMPWSTEELLSLTIVKARSLGLSFVTLEILCDVDQAADIPEAWDVGSIIAQSSTQ